jgi:protein-tyrosine phosphatase
MSHFPVRAALSWEGGHNVRPLRPGIVRSGTVDRLTANGWSSAVEYGVRTVIDLRNEDEYGAATPPPEITRIRLPLDQKSDRAFWDVWEPSGAFGTPLYYGPHLERFPQANAMVIKAIAHAAPGQVLFHCGAGRDRTGQIAMLVLTILGAGAEEIGAEYVLSYGHNEEDEALKEYLVSQNTTAEAELARILRDLDVLALLRRGGATESDFEALRARVSAARLCPGSPA